MAERFDGEQGRQSPGRTRRHETARDRAGDRPDLTHRPDPYSGDPAHFLWERADAGLTMRPDPYSGDPAHFQTERADADMTFRPDPYAGPPGHNSDERWLRSHPA